MTFAMIYMAFGLILVIFAGELTRGDRFAVRTYQVFPLLKKLPRSNLAATSLNDILRSQGDGCLTDAGRLVVSRNGSPASKIGKSRSPTVRGISTLNHHFRAATSLSPLQYQKQLRLTGARERMLVEGLDATRAALEVGYESTSQFTREYKRLFGEPPMRDVKARRLAGSSSVRR
jgi:hypothetical protein